jgi:transcriptional regulator with XRE-family HTH domain
MNERFDTIAGAKLKAVRRSQGWRQSEVDMHMEWPPGTLRQLERGKLRLTLEHAHAITSLYEYDIAELAGHVGAVTGP